MTRARGSRRDYYREWRRNNPEKIRDYDSTREKREIEVIGIDGEGLTIDDKHIYAYMSAATSIEKIDSIEDRKGLQPGDVFEFLLSVKRHRPRSLIVGFSLGYDYTKSFEGLPTEVIAKLCRPELRPGTKYPSPIRHGWYSLNYLKGCFTVARLLPDQHEKRRGKKHPKDCPGCKRGEGVSVWDVWGFFQGSFVAACQKWGVFDKEQEEFVKKMKLRRGNFSWAEWDEVTRYCDLECQKIAELVVNLRQAHEDASLPLTSYYGAGSTAATILKKLNVKDHMPTADKPPALKLAIANAFFGGRFEISRIGPVRQSIYCYDIASAYPYQITNLPCLACGRWEHASFSSALQRQIERSRACLVHYRLPNTDRIRCNLNYNVSEESWGPFPLRTPKLSEVGPYGTGLDSGNIVYPVTSGGGWTTKDEFLVAQRYWPNVVADEAWIFNEGCSHQPFAEIPNIYKLRLEWGKETRGIVVKLGPNSIYGKQAQSVGKDPPYQCFEWATLVTGGCRAQLLELVGPYKDNILMTATDGIASTVPLDVPTPRDTGTKETADRFGKLPLGAWEPNHVPDGLMLIRPGIAFPLSGKCNHGKVRETCDKCESETKARGVGKALMTRLKNDVMAHWEEYGPKTYTVERPIFFGMKSSTSVIGDEYRRSKNYGRWGTQPMKVSFTPEPKRPNHFNGNRLSTWAFDESVKSQPYLPLLGMKGIPSKEAQAMIQQKILEQEQPDYEDPDDDIG